jgi:threonine-phosphate decarboxylase
MTAVHGGDVAGIARAFSRDPATLVDFSASINPLGPPPAVAALLRAVADRPAALSAYPDPHARELTAALAARHALADENIMIANGNAALLDASVRALAPRRCIVPVPAFSEYARALTAAGAEMIPSPLPAESEFAIVPERLIALAGAAAADLCIVSNPHNPSGRGEIAALIARLAGDLARLGCATIVDEAFADYVPELSVLAPPHALGEQTIVLRSLTKFFAIPAMRIGYGVASATLAGRIRSMLPSWPAGMLDQGAALAALADVPYASETIRANTAARAAFAHSLQALGARVFPPAANFIFCDLGSLTHDVTRLRDTLIRERGLVIRTFADEPALEGGAYVRVAVRTPPENARLVEALATYATT